MNKKCALLILAFVFAQHVHEATTVRIGRGEDQGGESRMEYSRKVYDHSPEGLDDLARQPYNTVFMDRKKDSLVWQNATLSESLLDGAGQVVMLASYVFMTFPAAVGILFATSQNQVKDDMRDFNQLNGDLKEKYDARFRVLDDDDVNTNSWITWTQSRERLQAIQDLTEDFKYVMDQGRHYGSIALADLHSWDQHLEHMFQSDRNATGSSPNALPPEANAKMFRIVYGLIKSIQSLWKPALPVENKTQDEEKRLR